MSIVSSGALIDLLRLHRLLPADRLAELPHLAKGRSGEARPFAKFLAQRGWLTVFQINEILSGRAQELAIGPYHVLDRLGRGGLSQVFKARHADYQWLVALKVLKPEALANEGGRAQFLQEMEAMAQLEHPNIVQFCDVDQAGDTFYVAMEFVEGADLGKHVALTGPLPVSEACDYIRQAALGLQHAHERNLVHRDLKPVNLYLTHVRAPAVAGFRKKQNKPRPLIKILDWGLASLRFPREASTPQLLERMGTGLIGTADYLSPEQARDAASVDVRGDIYSLGCSFFFLLAGQPPFPGGTLMQKLLQHQQAEPPSLSGFRRDVPEEVEAILRRMLAKAPQHRFQTPAAVAAALAPFVRSAKPGTGGQVPGAPQHTNAQPERPPRPNDRTPLPTALGGAAAATQRLSKAGSVRGRFDQQDTSAPSQSS